MLTGKNFAEYILAAEEMQGVRIRSVKKNSKMRYENEHIIVFLPENIDFTAESIIIGAHEIGHAKQFIDKSEYRKFRNPYLITYFLLCFISNSFFHSKILLVLSLSILGGLIFIVIDTIQRIEREANGFADEFIKKYLNMALEWANDSRNPEELEHEIAIKMRNRLFTDKVMHNLFKVVSPYALIVPFFLTR